MVKGLLQYIDSFIAYYVASYLSVQVVEVIMINTLTYSNNAKFIEASNHPFFF